MPVRVQSFTQARSPELLALGQASGEGAARAAYLSQVLENGIGHLVLNAKSVRMEVLGIDDHLVPILVNDGTSDECYFAAPESHYVKYLRHELEHMRRQPTTIALSRTLGTVGAVARFTQMNRCVSVNNWLFSTNPSLPLTALQLAALLAALKERYPDHVYVVRTVNPEDQEMVGRLESLGFRLLINRPVHAWDPTKLSRLHPGKRGNVRRDIRALEKSGLRVGANVDLVEADADRMAELYRKLYMVKHSRFNAFFSPAYFKVLIRSAPVDILTLRAEDELVGFAALFVDGDTIVPTIIGYDTDRDTKEYGLYRSIMALLFRLSLDTGKQLFLSTGASSFKLNRGSTERLEYEAVFDAHLSLPRRFPWLMMRKLFATAMKVIDTSEI